MEQMVNMNNSFGKVGGSAKHDLIDALNNCTPSVAVPLWEIEFQAWNAVTSRKVIFGSAFAKLTAAEQETALHINAEELIETSCKWGYAALTVPGPYWELSPGEPAFYWLPHESRVKQIQLMKKLAGDRLMLVGATGGVLGMPSSRNYVEYCYTLIDAPEQIDEMARQYLYGGLAAVDWMCDCGVEIMMCPADIADNRGPFYNPEQMHRFILPYVSEWAAAVRQRGCYAFFHSDGNLMPCLDDLCNCGLHAIQAIDPTAGMEMATAKKVAARRLCLAGNIDCNQLLMDSPDNIYAATKKLLVECKTGGGMILGCSNAVVAETPIENYNAMLRAWKEYGHYNRGSDEQ
jgi:hypothetical protein